jgi:hypothetical protein
MGRSSARDIDLAFCALAILFGAGALFHAAAIALPALAPTSPAWRHAVFVIVNAVTAWGMLRRPRFFVFLFAILCAQQLYSHGADAWHAWHDEHRADLTSLAVLALMPLALAALVLDTRRGTTKTRRHEDRKR